MRCEYRYVILCISIPFLLPLLLLLQLHFIYFTNGTISGDYVTPGPRGEAPMRVRARLQLQVTPTSLYLLTSRSVFSGYDYHVTTNYTHQLFAVPIIDFECSSAGQHRLTVNRDAWLMTLCGDLREHTTHTHTNEHAIYVPPYHRPRALYIATKLIIINISVCWVCVCYTVEIKYN